MTYNYTCKNEDCALTDLVVSINKSMSESSREERCKSCNGVLVRQYTAPSIGTSDGFKK
jgi:predicted nucleic acid-binding Zn ribbon protein